MQPRSKSILFVIACGATLLLMPLSGADSQPAALTASQSDALNDYNDAVKRFEAILRERQAQIEQQQQLPHLPGQALYLARVGMMSAYKDLTDAIPSRIGRPNKFGIPPAYFDADTEPLIDAYLKLFRIMEAPPGDAQSSATPFKDVFDLATDIARAKGLDAADAQVAGRIGLGIFFARQTAARTSAMRGRTNTKAAFKPGLTEDRSGQRKWAAIKPAIAAFDPALAARDTAEELRAGGLDHRFNHWTAVRDGLMSAHAELFPQIPAIAKLLPNPIDQMKFFELIQIVPDADESRAQFGRAAKLSHFQPDDHGISAQQQHFCLRARRPGQDIGDLSRDPRCHVALQR